MRRERVQDLFRHMEWADSLVWAETLRRQETASNGRIRELLHHVHSVQWAYLQIWSGEPVEVPDLASFEDSQAVQSWGRKFHRRMPELLDGFGAGALERQVDLPWAEHLVERFGKAELVTLEETILQVAMHSTYHRGQVNARLRDLDGEPPLTDYIAWLWMRRPTPVWSGTSAN